MTEKTKTSCLSNKDIVIPFIKNNGCRDFSICDLIKMDSNMSMVN